MLFCEVAHKIRLFTYLPSLRDEQALRKTCTYEMTTLEALPGVLGIQGEGYLFSGIWGEGSFIFRDLGRKHNFWGVLGSRKQRAEEKHFRELGRKVIFLSGSKDTPHPPPGGPHPCGYEIWSLLHSCRIS